jgi:glycine cleavage system H protein
MTTPDDRKYSKEHEWVLVESEGQALVGITHYAQEKLGDLVYLDMPPAGAKLRQSQKLGEVESVKAVSEIYAPISGQVIESNAQAREKPELVNQDPYGTGWLIRVTLADPREMDNLLTAKEYEEFLAQQD